MLYFVSALAFLALFVVIGGIQSHKETGRPYKVYFWIIPGIIFWPFGMAAYFVWSHLGVGFELAHGLEDRLRKEGDLK